MKNYFLTRKRKQKKSDYASSFARFSAFAIDNFIVFVIRYIIGFLLVMAWYGKSFFVFTSQYQALAKQGRYNLASSRDMIDFFFTHQILYETIFCLVIIFISGSFYWVIFPASKKMATPGKLLMKIKILDENDKPLKFNLSLYRYLVSLIPWGFNILIIISISTKNPILFLLAITVISIWYDPKILRKSERTIHDIICHTKVVTSLPKDSK